MSVKIHLQNASKHRQIPNIKFFKQWVAAALKDRSQKNELVIRIVDENESAELNQQYRHKADPTNVLAFPFETPAGVETALLGDIVICAPLVEKEAAAANKPMQAHWAHLVIHGVLHLLGYDHINDSDAMVMESLEIAILTALGFANPYEITH